MAKKCSGAVILESTDLGSDAQTRFVEWMRGSMPARALSFWVSDKLEKSARLRSEPSSKPGQDILELLSGSAFSFADRGLAVYEEVFAREVSDVIESAYKFMGLGVPRSAAEMDIGKANTLFRRLSLRSRWASSAVVLTSDAVPIEPRVDLALLHIYMEVIRSHQSVLAIVHRSSALPDEDHLSDTMIAAELGLSISELEADSACRSPAALLSINLLLEEYLLGLMKLKASASEFVYHLNESSVYEVLGLDVSATDAEVRKAYRNLAMQHHPDKGGDKELFQTITEAYEKILEIRGIAKSNMDQEHQPEEQVEKANIVEKEISKKPSCEAANDVFTRILKAAEECVRNAKLASELTSEALSQISCTSGNEELVISPILLMILKSVKICAYTSLDASSLALQVAASLSAELMNCGFDALNIASSFPLTNPDTATLIIHLGQVTAKAVACASQITKLAKTIETSTSEPPDEKHKLIRQRIQNSQMLHKVNSEILQQQQIIYNSSSLSRICLVHHEFLRSTFIDWTRACLSSTETKLQANILIRSVDLIVGTFREFIGLKECQGLAVSANPLVRLWKYETVADRGFALPFIAREIAPLLTRLAASRNRYRPESELAAEVWKALDLDIHPGQQLSLAV
jgi:DnaJ-domain-containing protein 1